MSDQLLYGAGISCWVVAMLVLAARQRVLARRLARLERRVRPKPPAPRLEPDSVAQLARLYRRRTPAGG